MEVESRAEGLMRRPPGHRQVRVNPIDSKWDQYGRFGRYLPRGGGILRAGGIFRQGQKSRARPVYFEPQSIPGALLAARHTAEFRRRALEYSWDVKKPLWEAFSSFFLFFLQTVGPQNALPCFFFLVWPQNIQVVISFLFVVRS